MTVESLLLSLRSLLPWNRSRSSIRFVNRRHSRIQPSTSRFPGSPSPQSTFRLLFSFNTSRHPSSSAVDFISTDSFESIPLLVGLVSYFASSDTATQIDGITLMNVVCNYWSFSASAADAPSLQLSGYPNYYLDLRQFTSAFKLYALLPCLHNIRTLHVSGFCKVSNQDWIDLYTRCPNIHNLTVTLSAKHFLGIMKRFHSRPDQEINDIALPQLKKLTLRRCSFEITYLPLGFTAALAEFLKDRITHRCSLDTLEITECDVTEDHIPTLEALTHVEWDGITYSMVFEEYEESAMMAEEYSQ